MSNNASVQGVIASGKVGDYQWLTSDLDAGLLVRAIPEIVRGKAVAFPTLDSGPVRLEQPEIEHGWTMHGEIAWHPNLPDPGILPMLREGTDEGYYELYTFPFVIDLGHLADGNPFEIGARSGSLIQFVNYDGFDLGNARASDISDLFWHQMDWIQPDEYLSDGSALMTFATKQGHLFELVQHKIMPLTHRE